MCNFGPNSLGAHFFQTDENFKNTVFSKCSKFTWFYLLFDFFAALFKLLIIIIIDDAVITIPLFSSLFVDIGKEGFFNWPTFVTRCQKTGAHFRTDKNDNYEERTTKFAMNSGLTQVYFL